jgi:hypothetical protein
MPFVPVPNTIEVQTIFELDGQIVENTSYFEKTTGWDFASVSAWLTSMRSLVETELLPTLSSGLKLVRLIGTLLDAVDALSLVQNVSPPVSGSDTGEGLPNNSAFTITFLTAGRGRSMRGRNYVCGLTTTHQLDPNHVTDTFRSAILNYYDQLRAAGSDDGILMVVVSRFSGKDSEGRPIPRVTGVTTTITGFTTYDNVLDSQRRRLPGRGT